MEAVQAKTAANATRVRATARAPRWVMPTLKIVLVLTDATVAVLSFFLAFALRESVPAIGGIGSIWSGRFAPYAALLPFVIVIRVLSLKYCDLYRLRGEFSYADDAIRIGKAAAIGSLLIVATAFLYRGGFQFRAFSYARSVFVFDLLLMFAITLVLR